MEPIGRPSVIASVGDVNADGADEYGVVANAAIRIHSGATGAVLQDIALPGITTWWAAAAGDSDGDGFGDVVVGCSYRGAPQGLVSVYSGATGALRWQQNGGNGVYLGETVCGLGDVDGDGRPDVANGGYVWSGQVTAVFGAVYSGATGAFLGAGTAPGFWYAARGRVARGGRIDADAVPDLLLATAGEPVGGGLTGAVRAFSGANGSLIRTWTGLVPGDFFASSFAGGRDFDLDGADDVVVAAPGPAAGGTIRVFSGATGAAILSIPVLSGGGTQFPVTIAGDVDLDLRPEIVVMSAGPALAPTFRVFRGSTGSLLTAFSPWTALSWYYSYTVRSYGAAGDVNGDGRGDLVFAGQRLGFLPGSGTPPFVNVWSVASVAAPPVAVVLPLFNNCPTTSSDLQMQRPVLGTSPTLRLASGSPSPGVDFLSAIPPAPPPTLAACAVYVDPAAMVPLAAFTPAGGLWSMTIPISAAPALAGLAGRLQAIAPSGPGAFELSNGLDFVIGY